MNRSSNPTRGKRLGLVVAFLCALVLVAASLFFILHTGAQRKLPAITQDPTATPAQQRRMARCAGIFAEIERLDAPVRQPLSATSQNMLREYRRKLVDEKSELKC